MNVSTSAISTGAAILLLGCGGGPTGTRSGSPCAPSGTVTLGPQQGATVDCSNGGTTITVAGNGASYLVVPEFAADNVPYQFQSFSLGHEGRPTVAAATERLAPSPPAASPLAAPLMFGGRPWLGSGRSNHRQAAFDLRMLATSHRLAARPSRAGPPRASGGVSALDTLNQLRSFQVLGDSVGSTFKTSVARLGFVGSNVYVYVDTAAPPNGFTAAQLTTFGQYADQLLYQLDVGTFGGPTDVDHNGHVIMLLTQVVNGITPASECDTQGFVSGFFYSGDLQAGAPGSNGGEIFYQVVPDPTGKFSCAHSTADVVSFTPGTFLHELQHMINFGHHVILHHGSSEAGWLDEGESIVATELGARHYEALFPPPTGRKSPSQIFPDSAEPFITEQFFDSYNFLLRPDTASLTLHTDADCCLAWRGGDWLLLRYMGDQYDSTVYTKLEDGTVTGTANLAAASGVAFPTILGNFGVAVFVDSLPGAPRSAIPPRYQFTSYNLRAVYQALFATARGQDNVTKAFPIATQAFTAGSPLSGSMVPGTMAYYQLTTPSGSSTVTLRFATPSGGALASSLRPQVAIFRVK